MDQRSFEDRLRRVLSERLGHDESQVATEAYSEAVLGADSLDLAELMMSLEEDFGIEFSDDDWLQGSGVPRRGPFPLDSGAAEAPLPGDTQSSQTDQ